MPNWCWNRLEVQGTEQDMTEFYSKFKVNDHKSCDDFKMDWFVPRPEHEEKNWYNWNCENWGTKWDVCEPELDIEIPIFSVTFDTAWSPPIQFFERLAEMFPNLTMEMEYEEPGMAFCGIIHYSDGDIDHSPGEIIQVSDCCEKEVYWHDNHESSCSKCGQECESQDEHSYH